MNILGGLETLSSWFYQDCLAERSKALCSGRSHFGGVGSNPTAVNTNTGRREKGKTRNPRTPSHFLEEIKERKKESRRRKSSTFFFCHKTRDQGALYLFHPFLQTMSETSGLDAALKMSSPASKRALFGLEDPGIGGLPGKGKVPETVLDEEALMVAAATQIQRCFRGLSGRKRHRMLRALKATTERNDIGLRSEFWRVLGEEGWETVCLVYGTVRVGVLSWCVLTLPTPLSPHSGSGIRSHHQLHWSTKKLKAKVKSLNQLEIAMLERKQVRPECKQDSIHTSTHA